MANSLNITLLKMNTNNTQAEKAFVVFFQDLLNRQRVEFGERLESRYHLFEGENENFILDFMHVPYTKPSMHGYHFCIDHFLFHKEALESRILSILGANKTIFARNCSVKRIDKPKAERFFKANHLAGFRKAKFKYGLFYKDELMAAITFAQGRNFGNVESAMRSFECIGFCQAKGITVTGGLSKLIKHFVQERNADHLTTYIDLDWSKGEAFHKLGFSQTQKLDPLPFNVNWETGERTFPTRAQRNREALTEHFAYLNSGYLKFEHLYTTKIHRL